jgi:hypothetical protein
MDIFFVLAMLFKTESKRKISLADKKHIGTEVLKRKRVWESTPNEKYCNEDEVFKAQTEEV